MSKAIVIVGAGVALSTVREVIKSEETATAITSPVSIPYRRVFVVENVCTPFVEPYERKNECKKGWRK